MKRQALPSKWLRWRRSRFGALLSEGMRADLAYRLANAETLARKQIAKYVGVDNARRAILHWKFDDDRMSFVFSGPADKLSSKHKEKLLQAADLNGWLI